MPFCEQSELRRWSWQPCSYRLDLLRPREDMPAIMGVAAIMVEAGTMAESGTTVGVGIMAAPIAAGAPSIEAVVGGTPWQ